MINNQGFEKNCIKIARDISRQEKRDIMIVNVSGKVIEDFNAHGEDVYFNEINKHLTGCNVKYRTHGFNGDWFFEIYFEKI